MSHISIQPVNQHLILKGIYSGLFDIPTIFLVLQFKSRTHIKTRKTAYAKFPLVPLLIAHTAIFVFLFSRITKFQLQRKNNLILSEFCFFWFKT